MKSAFRVLASLVICFMFVPRLVGPVAAHQAAGSSLASAFAYHLPWSDGWRGTVLRGEHQEHAVDFDLWGGDWGYSQGEAGWIVAARAGTVVYVKDVSTQAAQCSGDPNDEWWWANMVVLGHGTLDPSTHQYQEYSWYVHLAPNTIPEHVRPGIEIHKGEVLGQEGNTGCSNDGDTVHLHFEVSTDFPGATSHFSDAIDPATGAVLEPEQHASHAPWPQTNPTIGWVLPSGCSLSQGNTCWSETEIEVNASVVLFWDADYHGPAVLFTQDRLSAYEQYCDSHPQWCARSEWCSPNDSGTWFCNIPPYLNDKVSSVRVMPQGYMFTKFHLHAGGAGCSRGWWWTEANFDNDWYDADGGCGTTSLNDSISSVYIDCQPCAEEGLDSQSVGVFSTAEAALDTEPLPLCGGELLPPSVDNGVFIADITIPDGTVVTPGEALQKIWRVRNSGASTWDSGYQLVFVSGNQMGAPSSVNLPHSVAPGQTVDIGVNITAPPTDGAYQGNWRMRNPSGAYFGDAVWVNIQVGTHSDNIVLTADPPSPASADQVRIYARVNDFPNLRALRILVDEEQLCELGAPEIQDCVWHTNDYSPGQHSISAEADDWTGPSWDNPERRTILYEYTGSGVVNHAPYRPTLVANPAYDWYVTIGDAPQLCAQHQGDPDGDGVNEYRFVATASVGTVDSGWVASACHSFGSITPGTYEWHAQVRDSHGGVSEWSDPWHFTAEPTGIDAYIDHFTPASPSNAEEVKIYGCTSGHAGVNITMRVLVNDANDGTDAGEWHIIKEQGSPCFNDVDVPIWRTLEYGDGPHLVRLVAWAIEPDAGDIYDTVYTLNHRRPDSPRLVAPVPPSGVLSEAVYLNSRAVTFKWEPTIRADTYTLHVSADPSPSSDPNPVFRQTFDPSVTEYMVTFDQDYAALYWQVEATNDVSSNFSGAQRFGIDRQNPACTVPTLTSPSYESVFQVNWSGTDNLTGIRSFDIQFMDSERGAWEDWLTTIPSDRTNGLFTGQPGHTYFFRCRATDNAANMGDYPGSADTSMTVDPAARPPTPWWDSAYGEKRNITILNNMSSTAMPVGYFVHLRFDSNTTPTAAELYSASLSSTKCNDLRIVASDTTELSRVVKNCSSTAIDIWFRSQVSVPGGASDNTSHQLYYGNASAAAPPADPNQVWYPYREADTTYLYFLQEGSGSVAYDSSGNGRNCSIDPSVLWTSSKFGHGLDFNRANYGDSRSLYCSAAIPLTAFTIEFWYKPDADDGGRIAGELNASGQNWLLQNLEGRIRLDTWECPTCGSQEVRSNFSLRDARYVGRWNHIAVTFNGGNQVKFYINGALDSTKYLEDSGINTYAVPLEIGSAMGIGQIKANMGTFRISSSVKTSFPYGSFAAITNEPTTAVGQVITPAPTGSADLAILSLSTYPNPSGGVIVEAVVQNQGDLSTLNGFYTDLYLDHLPTGAGDYAGSLRSWINDPIAPGETTTLAALIDDLSSLSGSAQAVMASSANLDGVNVQSMGTFTETSGTLYAQTDSMGLVREQDKLNNIYASGMPICTASPDSFEDDDTYTAANTISVGGSQTHNFSAPGDQDWIRFDAEAGKSYLLTTGNLGLSSDTYLYLYDTNGTTLLASSDDFNGSLASQIEWAAPTSGTYYALVKHWNPNVGGCGTSYDVALGEAVHAGFTATPTSGAAPLEVQFTNTSTGNYTDSLWDFGDGLTSTLEAPVHTYTTTGTYTVTLTVSSLGGSDTLTQPNYITVYEPMRADFSASPTAGVAPLAVAFTNTSTGDYTDSLWDFGDGQTDTTEAPIHIYATSGIYTVTLTVSGLGATDTLTRPNYVTVHEPVQAGFSASATAGPAPLTVVFTNTSTGDYTDNLWDFGDGLTSTLEAPTHTYSAGGAYTVTLSVSGPVGADTLTRPNYIQVLEEQSHVGDLDGSVASTNKKFWWANVTVTIHDSGHNPLTGATVTGIWSGGISGPGPCVTDASGQCSVLSPKAPTSQTSVTFTVDNVTHATLPYNPSMNHDQDGDSDGTAIVVSQAGNQPPVASFTYECVGLTCTFDGSGSSDPDGTIVDHAWDFGDGNGGKGVTASHTYLADGTYTVSLTVTDDAGAVDTDVTTIVVPQTGNQPPVASFTYECVDLTCTFDGSNSSDPDGTIVDYAWDLGDGNGGTGVTASHTYLAEGTYTVALTVTDDVGAADTNTQEVSLSSGGGTMFIFDIVMSGKTAGPNRTATVVVTVHDTAGSPVEGVILLGTWSGDYNGTVSGVTAADGTVTFTSSKVRKANATFTFTVDDLVQAGYTYDPSLNNKTSATIVAP